MNRPRPEGFVFSDRDHPDLLTPLRATASSRSSSPRGARQQAPITTIHTNPNEEELLPLQRSRPPEVAAAANSSRNGTSSDAAVIFRTRENKFADGHRFSLHRASAAIFGGNGNYYNASPRRRKGKKSSSTEGYSCREMLCLCLLPCLLVAILLLAVSNLATYFSVSQEMHTKMEQIRKELDDQRDRDGGVFISTEKKLEFEEKAAELEKRTKEFVELSVSEQSINILCKGVDDTCVLNVRCGGAF
jgi:hypothetical protein